MLNQTAAVEPATSGQLLKLKSLGVKTVPISKADADRLIRAALTPAERHRQFRARDFDKEM